MSGRKIAMGWHGLRVGRHLGCCKKSKKGDSSKDRPTKRLVSPQAIGRYENLERSVFDKTLFSSCVKLFIRYRTPRCSTIV
jgi:hypothetical protein